MAKRNKRKIKVGSLITGFLLGALIGWYVFQLFDLANLPVFDIVIWSTTFYTLSLSSIVFGLAFLAFAWRKPVFVEYIAYAVSIYVIFQFAWDGVVENTVGHERMYMFIHALVSLTLNIFSGHVKLIGATKTARNAVGLGN